MEMDLEKEKDNKLQEYEQKINKAKKGKEF